MSCYTDIPIDVDTDPSSSSYVIGALQLNSNLPFEMERLQELVKMDSGSRKRHKEWITTASKEGRGVRAAVTPS